MPTREWHNLNTPCLILDRDILQRNIDRMADRARSLGVALRPHVKTPKSLPVAEMLRDAGAQGFTVSTLQEAEYLFAAGFDDLFYAVPADAMKLRRAAPVLRAGKRLSLLVDTLAAAKAIGDVARDEAVIASVWVEIDVDHYRTGIRMDDPDFGHIVHLLSTHPNLKLAGIMSYGGASYGCPTPDATANLTERHRLALLQARTRVCSMGFASPLLSFGSTPAVLHAHSLEGIDEARCGIYAFQDLFQAGIGACTIADIALSTLASVISHSQTLNRFTLDAGALALSKDRSTQGHPFDAGFGLVCDAATGAPIGDLQIVTVSQELGLVGSPSGAAIDLRDFPIGRRLRILPNHADMTAAAYEEYHVLTKEAPFEIWRRTNRW